MIEIKDEESKNPEIDQSIGKKRTHEQMNKEGNEEDPAEEPAQKIKKIEESSQENKFD